ncbi:MAG TPA: carboxymuconolactone decarboxylase family protein [Terracidiphilus sp.]|jgi:AhpD family alkylhydroperoxidase|nr:carboxymuconolactone decarboxylase family protein [Terracidiphilus sp.]
MQPRIKNPAALFPDALQSLLAIHTVIGKSGLSPTISALAHLRISQINGCSVCIDIGWRQLKMAGESDARLFTLAAWREAPYFTDAERAALALAEALTRVADRPDPVPDEIWNEAARHFSEKELAGLTLSIAVTNTFNRLNIATRQIAGEWTQSIVEPKRVHEHAVAV